MKKIFTLLTALFLLNGCAESFALLGSSVGGASSGKVLQSSLNSAISYGVKHKTGKTPLGHMLAYAEKNNPDKKKETCISFIESTRSEFCTIAKNQISLTNATVKEKVNKISKKYINFDKTKNINLLKDKNSKNGNLFNKSARELAIVIQSNIKRN